VIYRTS